MLKSKDVTPLDDPGFQIFVGLDDENYGATLRLLPAPPE
jgi:hypothetical protein